MGQAAGPGRPRAEVVIPTQATGEQAPQVVSMLDQGAPIDRIGELLKAKGCQGTAE